MTGFQDRMPVHCIPESLFSHSLELRFICVRPLLSNLKHTVLFSVILTNQHFTSLSVNGWISQRSKDTAPSSRHGIDLFSPMK
jgi:hypothetical protein